MKSKKIIINFVVFFIVTIILLLIFGKNNTESHSSYWLILAVSFPVILRFIFPSLKELGIGTSEFLPNLMKLINSKLKKN